MRGIRPDASGRPLELNMTPMIDVVFQLLLFFMLSMRFSGMEGRLLTTLPRHKGTVPRPATGLETPKVRIVLCGGDPQRHSVERAAHDEPSPGGAAGWRVLVDGTEVGLLDGNPAAADRRSANRGICREAARRAREFVDSLPASRDRPVPVVLDADGGTPYEHVIGLIDACQEAGLDNLEFTAAAK